MASEDSDQLVPGFLSIHGLSDFSDRDDAGWRQMKTRRHHL
jgi:hypothetical protein